MICNACSSIQSRTGGGSVNNEPTGVHSFDAAQGDSITNQYFMGGNCKYTTSCYSRTSVHAELIFCFVRMFNCYSIFRTISIISVATNDVEQDMQNTAGNITKSKQ